MAKGTPTFSIITPSFNQAEFLGSTIESIWSQEGNFYIEHIIADGGSTDNSVEVIKEYERQLKSKRYRVRCSGVKLVWWTRPDKGQSDAINQGFRKSTGDYLAWLNSDDMYEPKALDESLKAFRDNPGSGMVYANYSEVGSDGKNKKKIEVSDFSIQSEIDGGNMIPQPSVFMRREALFEAGLLDPKYHYAMDYELWIKIGLKHSVVHVPSYWSMFRLHDSSKTVSLEKKFWKEEREISRKYGAPFFSQHLINHHNKYHPRFGLFLMKARNAYNLAAKGQLLTLGKRLFQNTIIFLRKGRK